MDIYLVQHGEASEDPERQLSENGKNEVEKVAKSLAKAGVKVDWIMHSGKLRAKQTAGIFSKSLKPKNEIREMLGLAPNDNPRMAKEFLETAREPVMLVGHLPHMTSLASLLLNGNPDLKIVKFRMGGVVCLEKEERWMVKWILTPDIV